jgi:hypothetical protein
LTVLTYPVADLVVPIPTVVALASALKEGEKKGEGHALAFGPLTDLITRSIDPSSWSEAGGPASIQVFETTLSLVVRQSPSAHEQIGELLQQLRRLQDFQVNVTSVLLMKASEDVLKKAGIDSAKAGSTGLVLEDAAAKGLLESAQGDAKTNLFHAPKVTLFNGQAAEFAATGRPFKPGEHPDLLELQPAISADRRSVRMNVRLRLTGAGEVVPRRGMVPVPDGKSLLIDVTPQPGSTIVGVNVPGKDRLFRRVDAPNGERTYLLLTPRIIVQEEEEELLGIPAGK